MNTQEMLNMLTEYFSGFILHESFIKELLTEQFVLQELTNIKKMGHMIYMADDNEQLKGEGG